jgi:hypothetical protein
MYVNRYSKNVLFYPTRYQENASKSSLLSKIFRPSDPPSGLHPWHGPRWGPRSQTPATAHSAAQAPPRSLAKHPVASHCLPPLG